MNIDDIIKTGGVLINNPNYNPKKKKNKQPKFLLATDLNNAKAKKGSAGAFAEMATARGMQDVLGTQKELDKYKHYGITPNDFENLNNQLADAQGFFSKMRNSIGQTLISELTLGTFKGFSDLYDMANNGTNNAIDWIEGLFGKASIAHNNDYTNPVSSYLEEKQEEFRQWAPIHTRDDIDIFNGGLKDAGWWFSNMPSIISSLTLMVPGAAVTKTASLLGKLGNVSAKTRRGLSAITGATKRLNRGERLANWQTRINSEQTAKTVGLFLENGTTAAMSRAMENYQEARQTYNDMYIHASEAFKMMDDDDYNYVVEKNKELLKKKGIKNTNDKDAVAKAIAEASADITFAIDWGNIMWDVIQMYGLRNGWKGLKNAPTTPSKITRLNKDAAKYFDKNAVELAAIKKERSFGAKAKEYLSDKIRGIGLVTFAESSEGVEEALNYIAQQEGLTFGKNLVSPKNTKKYKEYDTLGNMFNGFDGRLIEYMQAPELWESAFWGVLGGVTFQKLGSTFNRLKTKLDSKSEANEESKQELPWYQLDELPENKGRIAEIHKRGDDFRAYKTKLDQINQGIDIFRSTPENTVYFEENDEESKAAAREKLKKKYITKMTLRALRTGNFDLFKAYLADDNVRKGMIEAGFFNEPNKQKTGSEIEAESKQYIDDILKLVDKVEKQYDNELIAVNTASAYIDRKSSLFGKVPTEYMQIIANNNINNMMDIEENELDLAIINNRIAQLQEQFKDELKDGIDHERNIRTAYLINELGQLRAQRKALAKDNTLSNRLSIKNIDNKIKTIEDKLDDEILPYATFMSLRYSLSDDGKKFIQKDNEISDAYRQHKFGQISIGEDTFNILSNEEVSLSEKARRSLTDEELEKALEFEKGASTTYSELKNISPELDEHYQAKMLYEQSNDYLRADIARTPEKVAEKLAFYHNTMNEEREKAINNATATIQRLVKKYGEDIRSYISAEEMLRNTSSTNISEIRNVKGLLNESSKNIEEADFKELKDALNILALSKSYNKHLFSVLDAAINRALLLKDFKEEENAKLSNDDSEDLIDEEGNNTTQQSNPDIAQNNGQQGQTSNQSESKFESNDPQSLQNRTPIFHTTFRKGKEGVYLGTISKTDTSGARVYDNNDGTFSIDIDGDAKAAKNKTLFANADSIDVTRGWEVETLPIAKKNSKGKLKIVEQGTLRQTDTAEYQEGVENGTIVPNPAPQSSTTISTNETTTENAVETNDGNTAESNASKADDTIPPSTGEGVQSPSTDTTKKVIDDKVDGMEKMPPSLKLLTDSINRFQEASREASKQKTDVDFDALGDDLVKEYVSAGFDVNEVKKQVNRAKSIVKNKIKERRDSKNANIPTMQSSVDELIIRQSSIAESPTDSRVIQKYKKALKDVVKQYVKEAKIVKRNGKSYVNLESLLRYINNNSNGPDTARILFDTLKQHLNTDEFKKDFIITDIEEVNQSDFLDNVEKSAEQRYLEKLNNKEKAYRINLRKFLEDIDSADTTEEELDKAIERFGKALDSIKKGDKISYKIDKENHTIWLRTSDGTTIGSMVIPQVDPATGKYIVFVKGWKVDIDARTNGAILSNLKNEFLDLFLKDTPANKEIVDYAYEIAYGKPSEERMQEIINNLNNNTRWKALKNLGYFSKQTSTKELLEGLGSIIRFNHELGELSELSKEVNIRERIGQWFKQLRKSYDVANLIAKGNPFNMEIDYVSDGDLIRASDDTHSSEEAALPINEAIAGGVNPKIHKIARAVDSNTIIISGAPVHKTKRMKNGETCIIIPNRSGALQYVNAFSANITDDFISEEAEEIGKAFKAEFEKLVNDYNDNKSDKTFDALLDFVQKALGTSFHVSGNTKLFNGINLHVKDNNFTICTENNTRKITFFRKNTNGGFAYSVVITSPEFEPNPKYKNKQQKPVYLSDTDTWQEHLRTILNHAKFNIHHTYIQSDNSNNVVLKGLATKQNGKFVINIGDKTWTYDSYNDFIINNNLVRVDTKPNEKGTSNFSKRGERKQMANQVVRISITPKTSSPVKRRTTKKSTTKPAIPATKKKTTESLTDRVMKILNSDSKDKGVDIFREVIGEDITLTEDTLKSLQTLELLPKNIKFDVEFNNRKGYKNANAATNPKTGEVVVGTKWLNMLNDPMNVEQAIRKLIHEELHNKLHSKDNENKGYIKSAKEIYDDFEKALADKDVQEKLQKAGLNVTNLHAYLFKNKKNPDVALEEFLVESLTSAELALALNTIDAKTNSKKSKNLLTKILELMSNLFGWNVRKGSLYEKELNTLRASFKTKVEDRQALEDSNPEVSKMIEDGKPYNLTDDEVYYTNGVDDLRVRVTSAIEADDDNLDDNGIPQRFSKDDPWIVPSTNIGTGVDEFTRDFFLGKLDNLKPEELEAMYPNVTGEDWIKFKEDLEDFKDRLKNGKVVKDKKITIVSRDIKAIGDVDVVMDDGTIKQLPVGGTLDLLGYDEDGNYYVFDMKTVHSDYYLQDRKKGAKWNRQLQLYKQFLEKKYNIKIKGAYILPIKVNYDTPVNAKNPKTGEDMGGTAVYEVKNPEESKNYSNPNRTQLIQDGEEFREAAPRLQKELKKNPKPGRIQYKNLDDAAKAILDGKVTAKDYINKDTQTEQSNTETKIEQTETEAETNQEDNRTGDTSLNEDGTPKKFGKNNSKRLRGIFKSEVTESTPNYTPEMQSIKEQAIANGTFMKIRNPKTGELVKSNLNERQWLQVRTENFKNWFGDWINNPNEASKVVDENGEPLVVYHGTLSEFFMFDMAKLGETTGKGYYTDKITGEKIPIDSSSTFFFTNNKNAAYSYRNLAVEVKNNLTRIFYNNLSDIFRDASLKNGVKLEGEELIKQREFIDNVLSPIMKFDVRREANKILKGESTLTEEQRNYYANKFDNVSRRISNTIEARGVSNMRNNLDRNRRDLQFILDNKEKLLSNTSIDRLEEYNINITSGYGNRDNGEVYATLIKEDDGYYVVGIPGTEGMQKLTNDNFDLFIEECRKGIEQNKERLDIAEKEGHYNKGNVMQVFLNIKNPLTHNYEQSPFPDKYKKTKYSTGYIAARQVKKAKENNNDGVIYKDVKDPFLMDSYGIFDSNQVKSATDNNGEFSTDNDDIRYSTITETKININSNSPSVESFKNRLPLSQQAKFEEMVQSNAISISCQ